MDLKEVFLEMETSSPIRFNSELCIGCNKCVNICQVDVLLPSIMKGQTPYLAFPSECWYCGSCVSECSIEGAINLIHPLMNQARWIEKSQLFGGMNEIVK